MQERFRSLVSGYIRDAAAAIVWFHGGSQESWILLMSVLNRCILWDLAAPLEEP